MVNLPGESHVIGHHALAVGDRLGQGGQGTVYRVDNRKINDADGAGWDVVFKEYNAESAARLHIVALTKMVALLGELSRSDGEWLCEKTAWPAAMVIRAGSVCGIIMRAAPDRFRFGFRGLSAAAAATRRLANLEYLLNDDSYVARIGLRVSERDRLELLADLADTLARLHRFGVAVGDLSPKNLLFSTDPAPECFLIDCDATRVRGESVLPQAETPDWAVPSGEELATQAGDVYKFGLLAIRLIARDQTTTDIAPLSAIDPALGALARLSLDPAPARRPLPSHWAERLRTAAATASTAPAAAGPIPVRAAPPVAGGRGPVGHAPNRLGRIMAAVAAVVVVGSVVVLGVVARMSEDGSSDAGTVRSQATSTVTQTSLFPVPTIPALRFTLQTTAPPPAAAGDCIAVNESGVMRAVVDCYTGAGAYRVTDTQRNSASPSCDAPYTVERGYRLCLEIFLSKDYCYRADRPEPYKISGWIVADGCGPGTITNRGLSPDWGCGRYGWVTFRTPPVTYCVEWN